MQFPIYFHPFGLTLHPHAVMEVIAYAAGFQAYLWQARREKRRGISLESSAAASAPPAIEVRLWIIAAAVMGAAIGSKLLAWVESPREYWNAVRDGHLVEALAGGKTIVGGLLGGWIGVEIVKRRFGIRGSTGDAYVIGLVIGTAIGRVGCFLTGLPDHTYGTATSLPWGVDFGDGIARHPTQLYESVAVLILGALAWLRSRRPYRTSQLFRFYLLGYLLFRFGVEFIKPSFKPWLGLSAIQIASLAGAAFAGVQFVSIGKPRSPCAVERAHPEVVA